MVILLYIPHHRRAGVSLLYTILWGTVRHSLQHTRHGHMENDTHHRLRRSAARPSELVVETSRLETRMTQALA